MFALILEILLGVVFFGASYVYILLWLQPDSTKANQSSSEVKVSQHQTDHQNWHCDDFTVLADRQSIQLRNPYRESATLTLSVVDSTIDSLKQHDRKVLTLQLDTKPRSRINFHKKDWKHLQVTEYFFRWPAETKQDTRTVQLHLKTDTVWFDTFQTETPNWPMRTEKAFTRLPLNGVPLSNANSPNLVSENLLLNSDGFAILFPEQSPLFLRLKANINRMLIISTECKPPYLEIPPNVSYLDLNFTIIAGANIRQTYDAIINQLAYIAKPLAVPDEQIFRVPTWLIAPGAQITKSSIKSYTMKAIQKFTYELQYNGFEANLLLLSAGWDTADSYLTFNRELFPYPKNLLAKLHKKGYRIGLTIDPNIRTDAVHFLNSHKELLLSAAHHHPQLNAKSKTMLPDFTNTKAERWFLDRLEHVTELAEQSTISCARLSFRRYSRQSSTQQNFDCLAFSPLRAPGDDFQLHDPIAQRYPQLYIQKYLNTLAKLDTTAIHSNAFKCQHLGAFLRLPPRAANWSAVDGLQSLIPTILTLSTAGYSFIVPDIIGGSIGGRPSDELYIRWLQATTFLPAMMFSIPPWDFECPEVVEMAKKYVNLHVIYSKTIIELANCRRLTGEPIIRPMWYVAPEDPRAFSITDQFLLGNDLLVSPVVKLGQRERQVYLPDGIWIDATSGQRHLGPGEIIVSAPLEELPYFVRLKS